VRIARTDLVNFMIDDLVESSLGFLKRKEKKEQKKKKCVILRHRVYTTEEYFMHYQYSRLYC